MNVHVASVSIEDGSGDGWEIRARSGTLGTHFRIYYRTDKRTGVMTPVR